MWIDEFWNRPVLELDLLDAFEDEGKILSFVCQQCGVP